MRAAVIHGENLEAGGERLGKGLYQEWKAIGIQRRPFETKALTRGGGDRAVDMSFVFSLVGLSSVLLLPSTARPLIANWEASLPPEARSSA